MNLQRLAKNWLFKWIATRVEFKIGVATVAVLLLLTIFSIALARFNTTDKYPEFQIINEARQKEFGAFTVKVTTGMFIKNFSTFNVVKNRFVMDCILWFEYNSDEIMLDTINMFSFDNGKILKRSQADIKIDGRKTRAKYDVRVEFKGALEYHKFPLEDHRISLVLSNNFVTPYEMFFHVDNAYFNSAEGIFIPNWQIRDMNTDSGYVSPQLDNRKQDKKESYPQASFTLNVEKAGIRKVLVIFLPLFLAIFLAIFSFMMNLDNARMRMMMGSSAVTALLGYRFVIENMLPSVGYFTTTDFVYVLLLALAFSVFVFQLLFARGVGKIAKAPKELGLLFKYSLIDTAALLAIVITLVVGAGISVLG
ncbi:hypothetical protein KAU11_03585 [Candidatus Babeliales bacterium]|nr:hypothetical protein [Candidatus Babeliales bacterium]